MRQGGGCSSGCWRWGGVLNQQEEGDAAAVEEVPARSEPPKDAGTNADGWRPYTMGELLGEAAEAAAGRSEFADGNGAGSATPERSRLTWDMLSGSPSQGMVN